ncbi:MAG: glycosyltransferase family 2 protein [Planctomycetes bacterium]|nr:glycosyltransferase family 2 protein [Planctomycetota bacterium]
MISVIAPVFNEEENLPTLYARVAAAAATWGEEWELLIIDDGSRDRSFEVIRGLHEKDPHVRALRFSRNFGHQTAVSAGLSYASGDAVAVIDADLQDPPEIIKMFLDKWREGYDVVYAVRTHRKENAFKRAAYWTFYRLLAHLSTIQIPLDSGDFCVMSRRMVDALNALPERNRFVRGLRTWVGFRQIGVSYERAARAGGETKYTFAKLLRLAMDGIINFSYKPLQLASGLGFLVAVFSIVGIIVAIASKVFGFRILVGHSGEVPGWTSLMLAILFLGGVQLFSLGVLGEYIARIFDEVKQRPNFIVESFIGVSPGARSPEDQCR